jgi:uncharacterized protein with PIN domain
MPRSVFRFYEELNDFLPRERRKTAFSCDCARHATVKNAIESLGVPHTEVEMILVNGESVGFSHPVLDGDRISVYPKFEALDVTPLLRIRERPLREIRFVADAHLGALAKYLRLLGFDTLYRNDFRDQEMARLSAEERRIVLTRDRDLLMHRIITHGCYVRAERPLEQLRELIERLDLSRAIQPFSRCLRCNGPIEHIDKSCISGRLAPDTLRYYDEFWTCRACDRVYWAGSHFRRLEKIIVAASLW